MWRRRDPLRALQIRLEGLDRDLQRRIGVVAPKIAAGEHDGIEPLRIVALALRGAVRKHMAAVDALDDPGVAAGVTRQARMRDRIDVPGANAVADGEHRRRGWVAPEAAAYRDARNVVHGKLAALERRILPQRVAGRNFVLADHVAVDH